MTSNKFLNIIGFILLSLFVSLPANADETKCKKNEYLDPFSMLCLTKGEDFPRNALNPFCVRECFHKSKFEDLIDTEQFFHCSSSCVIGQPDIEETTTVGGPLAPVCPNGQMPTMYGCTNTNPRPSPVKCAASCIGGSFTRLVINPVSLGKCIAHVAKC